MLHLWNWKNISQPHNSTFWFGVNTFAMTRPLIFPGPPCSSIWPHRPHKPPSNGGHLPRKPAAKEWFGPPMPSAGHPTPTAQTKTTKWPHQLGCSHDLIFAHSFPSPFCLRLGYSSIFRDGQRSTLRILLPRSRLFTCTWSLLSLWSPKRTSGNRTENWAKSLSQELWTWHRLHANDFATNNYLNVSLLQQYVFTS